MVTSPDLAITDVSGKQGVSGGDFTKEEQVLAEFSARLPELLEYDLWKGLVTLHEVTFEGH